MDFREINNKLLPYLTDIILDNCPGGKVYGREYKASDIRGGNGSSFSFNLDTGKWADFATNDRGNDVISYYAHVHGINNGESAKLLAEKYISSEPKKINYPVLIKQKVNVIKPPSNINKPEYKINNISPTHTWVYRDELSDPLFYVIRYDLADGKKEFRPLCFTDNGKWISKTWPEPRPLYNLDLLKKYPDKPVIITEGEKAADAALKIHSSYISTTWSGGSQAYTKTDFSPLYGRTVLCWPDADEPGHKSMSVIASNLADNGSTVKYLDVPLNNGWDAADALNEKLTGPMFVSWAKPIAREIKTKKIEQKSTKNPSKYALATELNLDVSGKNKEIICNVMNTVRVLSWSDVFKDKIWFDVFHQTIFTTFNCETPRRWTDADDLKVLMYLQGECGFKSISRSVAEDAVRAYAFSNIRNELKEYLESLEWDGEHRINDFLFNAYGVKPSAYSFAVSRNWLIGLVARGINPGCKFDEMLILEGKQGSYKSTSLRVLAGRWFAEAPSNMDNKDFEMALPGHWIIEFGELDQFRKSETTLIKKKLSSTADLYRPSYGRNVVSIPRSCVFVGTTNKNDYLQDETGGRRFWPVWIEKANIDYIRDNRDQLFAEAVRAFKSGEKWHEMPESALDEQAARREQDPWEELIESELRGKDYITLLNSTVEVTCLNVLKYVIRISDDKIDLRSSRRVGKCLKAIGYSSQTTRRSGNGIKIYTKSIN